jgi:hypothetical protein
MSEFDAGGDSGDLKKGLFEVAHSIDRAGQRIGEGLSEGLTEGLTNIGKGIAVGLSAIAVAMIIVGCYKLVERD